jgi:hypothetical protein
MVLCMIGKTIYPLNCIGVDDFGDTFHIGTKGSIDMFGSVIGQDVQVSLNVWEHVIREMGE